MQVLSYEKIKNEISNLYNCENIIKICEENQKKLYENFESYIINNKECININKHLEELVPILYKEDYFNSSNDIVKYMFNKKLIHKYHSINNAHTICNLYIIIKNIKEIRSEITEIKGKIYILIRMILVINIIFIINYFRLAY